MAMCSFIVKTFDLMIMVRKSENLNFGHSFDNGDWIFFEKSDSQRIYVAIK